ncbi:LacI family DNA-binding transcriptional regulator [Sporolactobacillus kofuensis]|uniref:LacI family DNA-binding transcriptional regulator n=1 Tax=Sporolactobacillus kofuensis TaxID=269672 RepID=A0ABW1WBF6_9BACL|nr:LacI family DNA-binding transcriptional regulator [Sporolactobacillus kofuensis]MCO7174838.1 LacI family transcriptional regulator [Sporolactobacillus kofuensis]
MAGIKDIAKKAGVSISTVSYALNGSPKIPENTRKRIQEIADKLNYIPNRAARTLRNQKTQTIGVFLVNYGGHFYSQMIDGMNTMLASANYDLIVCCGTRTHHFIPEKMIDGAIILDNSFETSEILKYAQSGSKMVVLDRVLHHPNVSQVLLDNKKGIWSALDHLKSSPSYNTLYLLTGPEGNYDSRERIKSVTMYLEEANYAGKLTILQGDFTKKSGERAAKQIERELTNEPISILSMNDEMAFGLYEQFSEKKPSIGKDISIIGFDNDILCNYLSPKLTSVSYSKYEWGYHAAEKMLDLINGDKSKIQMIPTELVTRDSVLL